MEHTFIEVCAGCGGLGLGFIQAGFTPLLMNEIDAICCQTLAQNHPLVSIHCGSMTDLSLTPYRGQVDVLVGGVPCQSFSQAGKRAGLEDPRGHLLLDFKRLIEEGMPKMFAIENVKGLMNHAQGDTFRQVLALLGETQYKIRHQLLNANFYGVPQKRERIFIVGVRPDLTCAFEFPTPLEVRPVLRDALTNCPPSGGVEYSQRKKAVMELVPEGGCWIHLPQDVQQEYMGKSLNASGGKRGMARRLHMDEPCLTLTTAPDQKQTERCHPKETRPLTVREYARIQTFPDSYTFCGTVRQQYKQIGNAVPVQLAFYVATALKKALDSS